MAEEKTLIIRFSSPSELGDCPEDTNLNLSHDGELLDGVWRYYIDGDGNDLWSVSRGLGFYSEVPPAGILLHWEIT